MTAIIGLTGGIASGKSTISRLLHNRGFAIVDADKAARAVVEQGEEAYKQVVAEFGEEILQPDGEIDRAKLGSVIFHNEEKRLLLNSIVHPAVRERMDEWKEKAVSSGKETVIYDIPLLFESKLTRLVEKVIVVYVSENVQLERLMARNQLSEEEAKARIASQLPLSQKREWADAVIDNNGEISESEAQLEKIISSWKLSP